MRNSLSLILILPLILLIQTKAESSMIRTKDNIQIAFDHVKSGHEKIVIIAHGFYNNKDTVIFREITEKLSEDFDTITFDFRGHGKSTGLFEWTSSEAEDLKAVVEFVKDKGYKKIGVIGFSLGAAITIIESSQNNDIDSIIAVSSPYDFWKINYHFWEPEMLEDLKLNLGEKGKGKCIRPGNPFIEKTKPIKAISNLPSTPVLLVHGEKDWLINKNHSKKLFAKAKEPKQLHIFKNAGHAEKIFDEYPEEFMNVCTNWFNETL